MYRTNAQSTIVPDAIAIIGACTGSRAMMELAVALRAIVTGAVLLPGDRAETISRIASDLMNPRWNLEAHLTLEHPVVKYFAKAFCLACIQAVPLTPENPTRDLKWQQRVKEVLERDASLQSHAKLLLQQIKLRVTPAQPAVAPAIAVNATPSPKYDKAELQAKARQFAEEFVRRREAQKAQAEAAQSSELNPTQAARSAQETNSAPVPMPASMSIPVPAEKLPIHPPWATGIAAGASSPNKTGASSTDIHASRQIAGPFAAQARVANTPPEAYGLSPP